MKLHLALAATFLACLHDARAGWTTESYNLEPGWNGIYTLNDASHTTLDLLLATTPSITQVWRWEPTELSAQFITDPTQGTVGQEWKTWVRNDPANTTMSHLLPGHGHLVFVAGAASLTLDITGRATPAKITWSASGANLVGFPASTTPRPRFGGTTSGYLAPLADIGYSPLSTTIYRYVGGPIGTANPSRVPSPVSTSIVRGKAYWIDLPSYSDFVSPVRVELGATGSLDFGNRSTPKKILVTNRSQAPIEVAVTPSPSATPPAGQPTISGDVPLLQRTFNPTLQQFEFLPVTAPLTASLAPGASASWTLVPDHSAMAGAPGSLFASLLRITDSGPHGAYSDMAIPVTAEKASLGGLWVGDAVISAVQNQLQRFQRNPDGTNVVTPEGSYVLLDADDTIAATAQAFRLRLIVHVDGTGTARLLSNIYFGALDTDPPTPGFTTEQRLLLPATVDKAARITANHLPIDLSQTLSASLAIGTATSTTVTLPHTDPTNPFLHTYHPDHDNLDPRFTNPLPAGVESHTVTRAITLTVDASSPDGDPAWGTDTLTGTYAETLSGLHKQPIAVSGNFGLRRISDNTTITP